VPAHDLVDVLPKRLPMFLNLRRLSRHALQPDFSPSGKKIAFVGGYDTSDDTGTTSVASLDGRKRRELDFGAGVGVRTGHKTDAAWRTPFLQRKDP
jgi:Tol biopolymer transport system component